jgi:hypothetical protein
MISEKGSRHRCAKRFHDRIAGAKADPSTSGIEMDLDKWLAELDEEEDA